METNKISQIAKDAALNSFYGNLEVISKWSRSTFMDNASWIKTYMKPNIDILSEVLPDYFISEEKTKSLPDIMRENERLNKTVNDLLETGSSKLSIKQRQELESENEELKKGIKYAEKVAFDTSKQNADLMVKCETYKKDYDSMVAEVVKLSGEKSELLEALSNLIKVSEESTKDIVAFENADILDNCIDKAKAVITK